MMEGPLHITDREFDRIRDFMYESTGVLLKPSKKPLVVARLRSRMSELGVTSFAEYIPFLEKRGSGEVEIFINAITTNETFFFRHENQFNILYEQILPEIVAKRSAGTVREFRIWSAACSNGSEPYSLAIILEEFFKDKPGWKYKVWASDVNTEVLEEAREAIYDMKSLRLAPDTIKRKYFKHIGTHGPAERNSMHVAPQIRNAVTFFQHNLLDYPAHRNFDVVFLRNVMIYFDKDSKQKVIDRITDAVVPGGYLFISLAESLNDISSRFKFIKSGMYRKME